jgi:seryl-tRNA synthetase
MNVFTTLQQLDILWRDKQKELERLQALRNESIPKGKPSDEERQKLSELSKNIKEVQQDVTDVKDKLAALSIEVPIFSNRIPP